MSMGLERPALGQILRYAIVGLANTTLGYGLIMAVHLGLGQSLLLANLIGYAAGIGLSFALNRRWTFAQQGRWQRPALRFLALCAMGFACNLLVVHGLLALGLVVALAQVFGILVYNICVFIGMKRFVFSN